MVAEQMMVADLSLAPKVTRDEWRKLVRQAFGPALVMIDLTADPEENAKLVLAEVETQLKKCIEGYGVCEFAFGCTLFGSAAIKPFSIGPVHFESRSDWLDRKRRDGAISAETQHHIKQAWSGEHKRERTLSNESIIDHIIDTIGKCPFVCSVTTNGLAQEAGRDKALTAARLAITTIALLWDNPSKVLNGMNLIFDRKIHSQNTLIFAEGGNLCLNSRLSHKPCGPMVREGEWEDAFANFRDHFCVVGEVLDYMLDTTETATKRPKMMNTLAQALLWFHEGCRETVTLMAIVKFSAALDALACGQKSGGIRRLINARLNIQDSQPIRPNGPTLKQAVEEIYSDGRSRTIHGTSDKLGHDWNGTKDLAEQFACLCLYHCINWVAQNPSSDDPKQLSM